MQEPLVLIVEDSRVHQRLIMEAFKAVGYTTRFDVQSDAAGAWASVDAMLKSPPARWPRLAIVDIGLPGMSGIDLVDRIRHEGGLEFWPVVVLTASTDPDDRAESSLAAATAYFNKPTGKDGYVHLVRRILDRLGPVVGWTPEIRPGPRRQFGAQSK